MSVRSDQFGHVPVLRDAVLRVLAPGAGETYVDCTAGLGGHALAVAEVLGSAGTVVLNDWDAGNLERAAARVSGAIAEGRRPRIVTFAGSFAELPRRLDAAGLRADVVLADLGFASVHVDEAQRGFSFSKDGPLDMRMDRSLPTTAADLVATLPERELARIIYEYGEEPASRRIARKLVEARAAEPITSTGRLAEVVRYALGARGHDGRSTDPATRTFQALRIAVNDELGNLDALLAAVERGAGGAASGRGGWLSPGARVGIISFHSLEDRPVKRALAGLVASGRAEELTPGACVADEDERGSNPRSRSAKLRAVKIAPGRFTGVA